jgi:hypothetical protein
MKKTIIILLLLILTLYLPVQAEEQKLEGYIEYGDEIEDFIPNKSIDTSNLNINKIKPIITSPKVNEKDCINLDKKLVENSLFSSQEYIIVPKGTITKNQIGNFSYGSNFGSYLDDAQLLSTTGLYTRYDTKHLALTTGFVREISQLDYQDKIYIAPEFKFNRQFAIRDVMQTNMGRTKSKNEIVLIYRPIIKNHADMLQLELGAGQTYSLDQMVGTRFRFSTKINF